MDNTLIFLRHAMPEVDKETPGSEWHLSESGRKAAEKLAGSGVFGDIDVIYSSEYKKAYETALPFAAHLGQTALLMPGLEEVERRVYLPKKEFKRTLKASLADLDSCHTDWENARHALRRFRAAVDKIDKEQKDKRILIVTHGTVMSLYFAALEGKLDSVYKRWSALKMLSYGITRNGRITKDWL